MKTMVQLWVYFRVEIKVNLDENRPHAVCCV